MPSQLHEVLLLLFRNRATLAAEVLRDALRVELPAYNEAYVDSAELNEVEPTEYRADLVVRLLNDGPVLGIVLEIQLSVDERKQFAWPVYLTTLRSRLRCPVCLLVVTTDETVARWAAKPIEIGGGSRFVPIVLGPSAVPEVTDPDVARADPELAVLSAMAHGRDADPARSAQIAAAALEGSTHLDEERARLYGDLVLAYLSEDAREALRIMDPAKYEYQSEWVRSWVAQGRLEGRLEGEATGRAALVLKQLARRFGPLSRDVEAAIAAASTEELDAIGERLLTAQTVQEALGEH